MSIWSKMITALRGGVNEAGEAVIDSQAMRILDQEVRDATEELKQSKDGLANIMAQQKLAEEKCAQLDKSISEHEGYAQQALEKSNESLALEVAQKIADFETQRDSESRAAAEYSRHATKLKQAIQQAEKNIKRLKQQIDTVKATESVQRAQSAVAERHSGTTSKLRTAMDSLERIKEQQALKSAKMSAASELAEESSNDSLHEKLEQAGIVAGTTDAQAVLERIKTKNSMS